MKRTYYEFYRMSSIKIVCRQDSIQMSPFELRAIDTSLPPPPIHAVLEAMAAVIFTMVLLVLFMIFVYEPG